MSQNHSANSECQFDRYLSQFCGRWAGRGDRTVHQKLQRYVHLYVHLQIFVFFPFETKKNLPSMFLVSRKQWLTPSPPCHALGRVVWVSQTRIRRGSLTNMHPIRLCRSIYEFIWSSTNYPHLNLHLKIASYHSLSSLDKEVETLRYDFLSRLRAWLEWKNWHGLNDFKTWSVRMIRRC